ncbi:MAG: hypothetical protein H0T60_18950, partial [Acidobacteria bacterium]|nr:hypothetical protein [Acidobacteriota bacterium]
MSQGNLLFGHRLAATTDGSRLAIGAVGYAGFSGAVYMFAHDVAGWREEAFVTAQNR